jgi:hypothetical protein
MAAGGTRFADVACVLGKGKNTNLRQINNTILLLCLRMQVLTEKGLQAKMPSLFTCL